MPAFLPPTSLSCRRHLPYLHSLPSSTIIHTNRPHHLRPTTHLRRRRPHHTHTITPSLAATPPAPLPNPDATLRHQSSTPTPTASGFILWGPPGSGKTSLCESLSRTHGLVHLSTGALVRAHVLYDTSFGVTARPFVMRANPVPDDIIIPIVLERLAQPDCRDRGFLLDGFPRNQRQHNALVSAGVSYRAVLMLHAPRDTLARRIRYRRLDPETEMLYNLKLRPPETQEVLERLMVLDKDRAANAAELFASYGRATAETLPLISPRDAMRVDADRAFPEVLCDVADVLQEHGVIPERGVWRKDDAPPPPRTRPTVATRPDALGRASAVVEARGATTSSQKPASAAAALRTRRADRDTPPFSDSMPSYDRDSDTLKGMKSRRVGRGGNADGGGTDGANVSRGRKGTFGETETSVETPPLKSPISLVRCDGYMCERESVEESQIAFRGAATEQVMLVWNRRPQTVLLLVKKDPELMGSVLEAAKYLMEVEGLSVIVETRVQTQALANGLYLETFTSSEFLHERVDLVVCLGGDGLILHVSTLFRTAVPPVMSFNLGSLGFLTPFQYDDFREEVRAVVEGSCKLSLRMRLGCSVVRDGETIKEFEVMNEVVVDRGSSPYLCNLECFCDGKYITTVQADGIIMSTATGSTAYSMSAGGSMVHPSVPAILFTPICPHSLSFRPIVFPDSATLQIEISEASRSHAWASFDGKSRQQLRRGDGLVVQMGLFPVPTVNKTDHTGDWFGSLDRAFNFNSRAAQKPLMSSGRNMGGGGDVDATSSRIESSSVEWSDVDGGSTDDGTDDEYVEDGDAEFA